MAWALVQKTSQRVGAGANAKAFASNVTAGSLLLAAFAIESGAATITSIADNKGNAWTAIGTLTNGGNYVGQLYYAKNAIAGATTVTATPSTAASTLHIFEFSGLDTVNPYQAQAAAASTSATADSGSLTTTANTELLIGFCVSNVNSTIGAGFTPGEDTSFNFWELSEFKNALAPGSFNVTATLDSSNAWLCLAAAFREPFSAATLARRPTVTVAVELGGAGAGWTDVTRDTVMSDGITIRHGIDGSAPTDLVATIGSCAFTMQNAAARNSGGLLGYYSLFHANKRSGWGLGIGCRVQLTDNATGTVWTRFVGRIDSIDPLPGKFGDRIVRVIAVDWLDEAARWNLTADIGEQIGHSPDTILTAILAKMPVQPTATSFDVGTEAYAYALDTSRSDRQPALAEFGKLAASEFGPIYQSANGTLTFKGRHARLLNTTSTWTIPDTKQLDLNLPSTRDDIINTVRVTIHPKIVDAQPTTVVYSQTNPIFVAAGATKQLLGPFRDPVTGDPIGATDVQPQAAITDYTANTTADGLGTDLTSDFAIVVTAGASGLKFLVTNHNASDGWLTANRVRGRGIYDRGTVQYEARDATSVLTNGEHVVNFDMPYQDNADVAQGAADYILSKYKNALAQVRAVTVVGTAAATITQILTRDVNDRITVSETVTGVANDYFINGVALRIGYMGRLEVTYALAAAQDPFGGLYWILGTATLGTDTLPAPF